MRSYVVSIPQGFPDEGLKAEQLRQRRSICDGQVMSLLLVMHW